MFHLVIIYAALLFSTDTLKPITHVTQTTTNTQVVTRQVPDTSVYIETDSMIKAKFPSLTKPSKLFSSESNYCVIITRQSKREIFIAVLLLLSLITVTIVRAAYPKEFYELFSVLRSMPLTQQIYRVQANTLNMPLALLTINAVVSFSLAVYFMLQVANVHVQFSNISLFFIISAFVSMVFIYRLGSGLFTGILFPVKKEMSFYSFCTLQILRIMGIVLLPLNVLFAYGNVSIYRYLMMVTIVAILVLTGFIYLRGFLITKDLFRHNKFHFLLYICTLEIAPALTIIKFLINWVKR